MTVARIDHPVDLRQRFLFFFFHGVAFPLSKTEEEVFSSPMGKGGQAARVLLAVHKMRLCNFLFRHNYGW